MFDLPSSFKTRSKPEIVAAVDLGSNSFHMIVARISGGQIHILDRLKEMVRLAAGLSANNILSASSQQNALACLARFGQRLRHMPPGSVRIVGTNTLRLAANAGRFIDAAEDLLGHPIEIIAGREEARLIYLGVAHTLAGSQEKRLVIDIGGGSTEFIIGQGFETLQRESLEMGCVRWSQRYFAKGAITAKAMQRAEMAALLELQPIEAWLHQTGWDVVIGASGTLRSVARVITQVGFGNEINPASLQQLRQALLAAGHIDKLNLTGLSSQRTPVFPGGVAVILGIVEGLGIQQMSVSEYALREGLVYDLLGRIADEDIRDHTIQTLMTRYCVDPQQAERVENTALWCLSQVAPLWDLVDEDYAHMLSWAARLHECGLSISHDQYHKHGAYLLTHSDLAGFSHQEQTLLATLIQSHRRKLSTDIYHHCSHVPLRKLLYLCLLLRLAVLLHRSRSPQPLPPLVLTATNRSLQLRFPPHWLGQHPLTQADLQQEHDYLQKIKLTLQFE